MSKLEVRNEQGSLFCACITTARKGVVYVDVSKWQPELVRICSVSADAMVTAAFTIDAETRDLLIDALQSAREAQTEKEAA